MKTLKSLKQFDDDSMSLTTEELSNVKGGVYDTYKYQSTCNGGCTDSAKYMNTYNPNTGRWSGWTYVNTTSTSGYCN